MQRVLVVLYDARRRSSRHDLDERRFASAVLADQRMDLARLQFEIDTPERRHAGKLYVRHAQDSSSRLIIASTWFLS